MAVFRAHPEKRQICGLMLKKEELTQYMKKGERLVLNNVCFYILFSSFFNLPMICFDVQILSMAQRMGS